MYPDVNLLKVDNLKNALEHSIPVDLINSDVVLVPVGPWILREQKLVSQMMNWREISRDSFFARFPPSVNSFLNYLESHSIQRKDTILFMIYSNTGRFLGHMGLTKLSKRSAEIDAVMIDPSAHRQGLAAKSLSALIFWAERSVGINMLSLELLSSNAPAIRLYSGFGFTVSSITPLKSVGNAELMQLVDCEDGDEGSGLTRVRMFRNAEQS